MLSLSWPKLEFDDGLMCWAVVAMRLLPRVRFTYDSMPLVVGNSLSWSGMDTSEEGLRVPDFVRASTVTSTHGPILTFAIQL